MPPSPVSSRAASDHLEGSTPPQVSVVVSTRDRAALLGGLLEALEAQSFGLDRFEVVVIDDGSRDDTWTRIAEVSKVTPLRLLALRLEVSGGQGAGRNVGVEHAHAPVVAFTDDDCLPTPSWLETLTRPLRSSDGSGTAEAGHLVVQGRTVPWPGDADAGTWARTVWVLRATWLFETCNIAYRKRDLQNAGGFPERDQVTTTGSGKVVGEDAMLGWRAIEQGASLVFDEDALVHHRRIPASYSQWLAQRRGALVFPALCARNPMARRALWGHFFLAPRSAAFDLAVAGGLVFAATRRARWLSALLPWVWLALPEAARYPGRHPGVRLGQLALGDLIGFTWLVAGSVRSRSVVL
ncbi:MAG TPA: glycosyltransferase [Acidimicrobiales bacterium]|nr:glycosyltransferase [Acidimicrobiales bacterium]